MVILIIGILAAIAIPSFLEPEEQGDGRNREGSGAAAQLAAETYAIDHAGELHGARTATLKEYETTLQLAEGTATPG